MTCIQIARLFSASAITTVHNISDIKKIHCYDVLENLDSIAYRLD